MKLYAAILICLSLSACASNLKAFDMSEHSSKHETPSVTQGTAGPDYVEGTRGDKPRGDI